MKHVSLILVLLFFTVHIKAQDSKKTNYKLNLGTTVSIPYKSSFETMQGIENHPVFEYKRDFDYFIEGLFVYNFYERFSLSSGISFINIKYDVRFTVTNTKNEMKGFQRFTYIGIPFELNYKLFQQIPLRLGIGSYVNILLHAKEKGSKYIDFTGQVDDPILPSVNEDYEYNITGDYKKIDIGLNLRIEYEIEISNNFSLELFSKFNFGLTNSLNNSASIQWKNYTVLFGIGSKI